MKIVGVLQALAVRVRVAVLVILRSVLGNVNWERPRWIAALNDRAGKIAAATRANPRRTANVSVLVLLAIAAAIGGRWLYLHRPHPAEIAVHANNPSLTKLENDHWKVYPLVVVFDGSVAPLNRIGKQLFSKPELVPPIEGTWKWEDDHQLSFQPKSDWPVGQEFTVTIPKKGFVAAHILLADYRVTFTTAAFQGEVSAAEFYQDPTDPNLKKVVATVKFTHPANAEEFEKHLHLHIADLDHPGSETRHPFTITYDKYKLNAYVHSAPIPIPPSDTSMWITVEPGIRAAAGGPPTEKKIERQVSIPGLYSFLRINSGNLSLVSNEHNEPEQIVVLETTTGVEQREMSRSVSVFVLPVNHPDKKIDAGLRPYDWSDPQMIGPEILQRSQPLSLDPIPYEKEYATLHSYRYGADVGRYLYVRVDKGVRAFGGYVLGKTWDTIIRVPEFPRELKILSQGSLLSMSGDKKVPIYVRDMDSLQFEVGRVLPDQLQHLVSQTEGDFRTPAFSNYNFNQDNISERFSEVRDLPKQPHGKSQYLSFDFTKYLQLGGAGEGRRGVFFFSVEGYDPVSKEPIRPKDSRIIVLTDLGILVKDALDGSHDLFVQSIATGDPVPGVTVQVIGSNGTGVLTANTGNDGHVHFPTLAGFKREQAPVLYLARKGDDTSFIPIDRRDRRLDTSRFDVGGVANAASADRLSAYLFSDRGVYRPGDEIHIGIIVKPANWTQKISGVPVEAVVTDARGLEVKREKLRLTDSGFEEIHYTTQETAPTGTYTVSLFVAKDNEHRSLLGSTTVRIQEFLPDRLKITTHLSREVATGWVSPENLKARVVLRNLFGTPAADHRITASIGLTPAYTEFAGFTGFTFYDPMRAKETYNEDLAETKTNDSGEADLDLNLHRYTKATYRLRFIAQGFEREGGRSVTAQTSMLVSPLAYLVGFKADGDLNYVGKGSKRSVRLIAINPEAKRIGVKGLKIATVERKYVSVLTKQENGTYKYESVKKEIPLAEAPLEIPAAGLPYALPSDRPGDFAILVRDDHATELNRIEYAVAGAGNVTFSREKNAELRIALNKTDYAPGDEIQLDIRAPYAGAGLITIERERVFQYTWFRSDKTSSVQKIRIPNDFEGNGYVSVSFIRDINSDEIFMSPLSYGIAPFSVSRDRKTARITLRAPDLARPGEPYRIHYHTDRPARIAIFAVDEGILQVARYASPDPLGYFFQKRALEVRTEQILDLILPEFKRVMALAAPGGDASGAIGKNLNPFRRKRDKPVVFWSGIIDAGKKEQELDYQLPDYFNGSLHLFAVAVSPDAVGVAQKTSEVRGDFVINPNVPTFVAPGDDLDVTVSVANNVHGSGAAPQVTLELTTSPQLEVVGPRTVKLNIGELREGTASFHVRARAALGSANLTLKASMGDRSGHYSTDLSIRPPIPYMTTLTAGHFRKGTATAPITRRMYPEYRTLQAGVSPLPLSLAGGLIGYLDKYPYGCTEQLTSMAMPAMVMHDRPEFGYTPGVAANTLSTIIGTLQSRQNGEGAFGLWASNAHVSDFASVYATHFLIEARERGFSIPRQLIDSSMAYLNQLAAGEGNSLPELRVRAYATYVLTRNGVVTTNYATALQKRLEGQYPAIWKKDLAGIYLAATYQMLKQEHLASNLIEGARLGDAQTADYQEYYDGAIRDAQLLYILAHHFPDRLRRLRAEEIEALIEPIFRGHYNTLSSAYTILALDAYVRSVGVEKNGKLSIAQIGADGAAHDIALPAGLFPRVPVPDSATRVQFENSADVAAFYVLTQAGFDTVLPSKAITNKLEVQREYTAAANQPLKRIHLGDEIEVHLKLRTINGQGPASIAVTDLLPGGFEVVEDRPAPPASPQPEQTAKTATADSADEGEGDGGDEASNRTPDPAWVPPIGSTGTTWHLDYADVREDRVVLYGVIGPEVKELVYRIKATNPGNYAIPPTFGEAMYDRSVLARSTGGTIHVVRN